jgi:hypothetical protein
LLPIAPPAAAPTIAPITVPAVLLSRFWLSQAEL